MLSNADHPFLVAVRDLQAVFDELGQPGLEDLIILKAIASRPRDIEDIRTIGEIYPALDRKRIRYWLQQYGELLETPELWTQIEPLLGAS